MTATAPTAAGAHVLARAWVLVRRLPTLVLLGLLRSYQVVISPMTGPTCRFYPSCSEYAVRAVRRHGPLRGARLAAWRVLRCNPWNFGGVDDVPPVKPKHHHPHVHS